VTCVRGCAVDLSLTYVALLNLTLCFLCDLYCKGERLQTVEIPRTREKTLTGYLANKNWRELNHFPRIGLFGCPWN
jgi:hypothetical protein